ncbi:MAG: hypothetical protein R3202_07700 [Candidatus Competibacterales bacterium]|nr:hypothetical protein [Candidatus Competibacterales bacterium]
MSDDYVPIDCEQYCRYEVAILHRQWLRIAWHHHDGLSHLETLLPLNLNTRNHAEYLLARNGRGKLFEFRLDRVIRVTRWRT